MLGSILFFAGVVAALFGALRLGPALDIFVGDPDDVLGIDRDPGPVELEGTAEVIGETVRAPLTETPCLVYEYEIEVRGPGTGWSTVDSGRGSVPFRLTDDTAGVRVDPTGARLALSTGETVAADGAESTPDAVRTDDEPETSRGSEERAVTGDGDGRVTGSVPYRDRRYRERRLEPGDAVYLVGQARYDVGAREELGDVNAVVENGPRTVTFVVADAHRIDAGRRLLKPAARLLGVGAVLIGFGVLLST